MARRIEDLIVGATQKNLSRREAWELFDKEVKGWPSRKVRAAMERARKLLPYAPLAEAAVHSLWARLNDLSTRQALRAQGRKKPVKR